MSEESLEALIGEIRTEFQIPPFFKDEGLKNYAREGEATLLPLVPKADIETDKTYRMLLKNYVNYAYYHKVHEWRENYAGLILDWQLNQEVKS